MFTNGRHVYVITTFFGEITGIYTVSFYPHMPSKFHNPTKETSVGEFFATKYGSKMLTDTIPLILTFLGQPEVILYRPPSLTKKHSRAIEFVRSRILPRIYRQRIKKFEMMVFLMELDFLLQMYSSGIRYSL